MRPVEFDKRDKCKKQVLSYLTKIKRPTTVGEINSKIGYNRYMIKIAIKSLENKLLLQGKYISLK